MLAPKGALLSGGFEPRTGGMLALAGRAVVVMPHSVPIRHETDSSGTLSMTWQRTMLFQMPYPELLGRFLEQNLVKEKHELRQLVLVDILRIQNVVQPLLLALWKASDRELIAKLRDPQPFVRWFAADILSHRQVHVEKQLIPMLKDPYREVRFGARKALVQLSRGLDFGPSPDASLSETERAMSRWSEWLAKQDPPPSRRRSDGAFEPFSLGERRK